MESSFTWRVRLFTMSSSTGVHGGELWMWKEAKSFRGELGIVSPGLNGNRTSRTVDSLWIVYFSSPSRIGEGVVNRQELKKHRNWDMWTGLCSTMIIFINGSYKHHMFGHSDARRDMCLYALVRMCDSSIMSSGTCVPTNVSNCVHVYVFFASKLHLSRSTWSHCLRGVLSLSPSLSLYLSFISWWLSLLSLGLPLWSTLFDPRNCSFRGRCALCTVVHHSISHCLAESRMTKTNYGEKTTLLLPFQSSGRLSGITEYLGKRKKIVLNHNDKEDDMYLYRVCTCSIIRPAIKSGAENSAELFTVHVTLVWTWFITVLDGSPCIKLVITTISIDTAGTLLI